MNRLIEYLSNRKKLASFLAIIYFLLVVLPHEQVGLLTVWVFKSSSRATYQTTVTGFGLLLLFIFLFFVYKGYRNQKNKFILPTYLAITIFLMVVSFHMLIIHNIEIIHFAQYAGMAILLYPLVKTISGTIFWSTILGTIDEAYQYFYLSPDRTDYFDFNDIILDLLGAAIGLSIIISHVKNLNKPIPKKWYKSPIILTTIGIIVSTYLLLKTSILQIYPNSELNSDAILLVRKLDPNFWTHIKHLHVKFHIVQPFEGIIIISLLLIGYWIFDMIASKKING